MKLLEHWNTLGTEFYGEMEKKLHSRIFDHFRRSSPGDLVFSEEISVVKGALMFLYFLNLFMIRKPQTKALITPIPARM